MGARLNKNKARIIDSYDEKILNELVGNSKIPLRTIATKLGISFVTVMNRIKKLEKEGIIGPYITRVDYEKLGYKVHVVIEARVTRGKFTELEKKLATVSNIHAVYDTTGEYDITMLGRFKTTRDLDTFLKIIQSYDMIDRVNTKIVLNTLKSHPMQL